MTDPISSSPLRPQGTTPLPKDDPERVKAAARQFEALLIGQMLKSMQPAEGGLLSSGGDESSSTAMEYGQEMFAQALASKGGLGLAGMIARGLEKPQEAQ